MKNEKTFPDGISERHLHSRFFARHLNWIALFVLGGVIVLALTGVFGGHPPARIAAQSDAARLVVEMPKVMRNGQFFEMRITIMAERDLTAPALALDDAYWRHLTINRIRPEAQSQGFGDGRLLLEYDALAEDETLVVTIEGQVNPILGRFVRGGAQLRDGQTVVTELPLELRILP